MSSVAHDSTWTATRKPVATREPAPDANAAWNRGEHRQFRWMVAVALPLLLVVATIGRLSGWWWRPWPPGREGYRSIFSEAKEAAETYIGFAFVGW
jgi:hypothetical protein